MAAKQLPSLTLVTFSGAHATGKSTLLNDLRTQVESRYGATISTAIAPSCSQELFRMLQDGSVKVPAGHAVPRDYADIDRQGLRGFFQLRLPDALSFMVESVVLRALAEPEHQRTIVFVDRWFTDIFAYTLVEAPGDEKLHMAVLERCRSRLEDLQSWLLSHAPILQLMNVFVPLRSSKFPAYEDAGKFRATCDRAEWERLCLRRWKDVVGRTRPMLAIASSDRKRRVNQILRHLVTQPSTAQTP